MLVTAWVSIKMKDVECFNTRPSSPNRQETTMTSFGEILPLEWRPIPGFPAYEVSSEGQIRRMSGRSSDGAYAGHVMSQRPSAKGGYLQVTMRNPEGRRVSMLSHIPVALAFLGPRPKGKEVAHWDGIGSHNHAGNLRYATKKENSADRYRHGTIGGLHTRCPKLTWEAVLEIRQALRPRKGFVRVRRGSVEMLAKKFGVGRDAIMRARNADTWKEY